MSIAPEHIDAIRERADILEVVGRHVTLRKSGRRHVGICPFHQEKTPSFSVASDKNLYHCFGCGVGGDAFDFVMRHDGVDFQAAARALGQRYGVALEPESPRVAELRRAQDRLGHINRQAAALFAQTLWSPRGQAAQAYLQGRAIDAKTARTWGLGMGPPTAAALAHLAKQDISRDALVEAGLLSDDGQHLLAAGRLMFPIHDVDGRIAGFGGRRLNDDASSPKYVNSRDSLLFKKSALMFGLYEALGSIRRDKTVIVVEGYTDVLAAYACGLTQAVAALGTAFTPAHAQSLQRLAQTAVMLLDADAAGIKASGKAAITLLQAGLKVNVAPLPPGEDPDSLRRKHGGKALQQSVARATPAMEFFMQRAFAKPDMSIEARVAAAQALGPMLGALASGLERELYTQRLADHVGVTPEQLQKHLRTRAPGPRTRARRDAAGGSDGASAPAGRARDGTRSMAGGDGHDAALPSEPPDWAMGPPPEGAMAPAGDNDAGAAGAPHHGAGEALGDASNDVTLPSETELHCLRELLLYPSLRARFGELADFARSSHMTDMLEALAHTCESPTNIIESRVQDPAWRERLLLVTRGDHSALDGENERANRTFNDVLNRFKAQHLDDAIVEINREFADLQRRGDTGDATVALLRRKRDLIVKKKKLRCVEKKRV